MGERWRIGSEGSNQNAKVRLSRLAARQWGRVSRSQVRDLGIGKATITAWIDDGYLHRIHPAVYAVGHSAPSIEGDLAAALLYAGPGAMLSHNTAAWWFSLIDTEPKTIHVSTPRRCKPRPGIRVHERRKDLERAWHKRLPTTTPSQTLLDYAALATKDQLRHALANADYRRLLDPKALNELLGQGRPGSAKLRAALDEHQPKLAVARSKLERDFVSLCESYDIPLPEVNVRVHGWLVDAFWPEHGLVVELDGYDNHSSPAQIRRDRRKELELRRAGLAISRYAYDQVTAETGAVASDVLNQLALLASRGSH